MSTGSPAQTLLTRPLSVHPVRPRLHSAISNGSLFAGYLVRSRFYPLLFTGDLKKAFLQVRIKKEERDSLRFHWRPPNSSNSSVLRFTRALFVMTCSHFLLGGVINQHLDTWESEHPLLIKEITAEKKAITTDVFKDALFTIHKWHSNVPDLEAISSSTCEERFNIR